MVFGRHPMPYGWVVLFAFLVIPLVQAQSMISSNTMLTQQIARIPLPDLKVISRQRHAPTTLMEIRAAQAAQRGTTGPRF